jgi:small subunit ribosomal protein S4e
MGRMGSKKHLKRAASPAFWPIHRKEKVWVVKPSPGPHSKEECIPLMVILRNMLGLARNKREAEKILAEGKVKVDGKVRRDGKFPTGLMDIVEIEGLDKVYRVVPHPKENLTLVEVNGEEGSFKLCRIENKTTVKGGHIQLNLHDGRNLLIKVSDPTNPEEDHYKAKDTVKLDLKQKKILGH